MVKGDAAAALARSAHVVEGTMTTAFVEHAYIEPEAGSARMEGEMLAIRACTQAPGMDREDTAAILGLPLDRVRIIPLGSGWRVRVQARHLAATADRACDAESSCIFETFFSILAIISCAFCSSFKTSPTCIIFFFADSIDG